MHLFAFSLVVLCLEICFLIKGREGDIPADLFPFVIAGFFAFYCVLQHVFSMFVDVNLAALFSIIPAGILYILLMDTEAPEYVKTAVIIALVLRLLVVFVPYRKQILTYGWFFFDVTAFFLYFVMDSLSENNSVNKLLFLILILMTLAAFQKSFPIHYFVLLGTILFAIPMSDNPIDWTPVLRIGDRIADTAENLSYSLPTIFSGNSYSAGYSSLNSPGGILKTAERTQLILRSFDQPYYTYTDEETGDRMRVRKVLYLAGGVGANKEQFISFINFLYKNGIESREAAAFSEISKINVEYAYIDTKDEIAPVNSIKLENGNTEITSGRGKKIHKKGYNINATYLDLDLGSQYLTTLLRNAGNLGDDQYMSYEEACDYVYALYNLDLNRIVGANEYEEILAKNDSSEYLETDGSTDRMASLAEKLTTDANSDYDKCCIIAEYLRQYPYNSSATGGHKSSSDMSTPEGMADIADRFLFDTKEGYCVHYTSAMIMLLRLSGIPARAVTGFRYVAPFEKSDSYPVSSSLAHTWPEAYIENVGWIAFEPTGSVYAPAEYSWHREVKEEADTVSEEMETDMDQSYIPYIPDLPVYEESITVEDNQTRRKMLIVFDIVIPVGLSIIAILLIVIIGNSGIRYIIYKRGSNAKKLQIDVEHIKKEINISTGNNISDRGLLFDYLDASEEDLKNDMQQIFDAYYRLIYGNSTAETITDEEVACAHTIRGELVRRRKLNKNAKRIEKMA